VMLSIPRELQKSCFLICRISGFLTIYFSKLFHVIMIPKIEKYLHFSELHYNNLSLSESQKKVVDLQNVSEKFIAEIPNKVKLY
jgi:hypothetical protein